MKLGSMCSIVVFYIFLIASCAIENVKGATSSAVPSLLHDCYRSNFTAISKPPYTIKLLIELIRKIELDNENAFNMRILATSMLHGVVLDGVRKYRNFNNNESIWIPYRATGEEFYKYQLIVDYLTSGESSLFPKESLTTPELCFLHNMISNTVEPWKRGDESSTCVHQSSMPFELETTTKDDLISTCPIQKGNVNTKWGPVSAGHIIAAVASALQQSKVTFQRIENAIYKIINKNVTTTVSPTITTNTNNVNNVWVSTIAGDLAAVILNQASYTPEIGNDGFWNDTLLPRIYYLKTAKWDMTESDILGGIDALAIANYVKNLSGGGVTKIRLSQLIDMYYSERGIMNNKEYKVTNRTATLTKLLNQVNLEEQVAGSAKLLQGIGTYEVSLGDQDIKQLTSSVTKTFKTIAGNITKNYDRVESIHGKAMKSSVEIIVIVDGSYDAYTTQQMIFALTEAVQVSHYGSRLGIINGQSGKWMANVTGELFQLFTDLYKGENEWPSTLSLGRSLETAIYYYQNKTTTDCNVKIMKPMGRSILIVSSNGRLTDNDLVSSKRAFNSIKKSNPEVNFIIATTSQSKTSFNEIADFFWENDHILTPPEDVHSFVQDISDTLSTIPGNFINFYCSQSEVRLQDYITPDVETYYQIRKEYIEEAQITTKFSNSNQEGLSICVFSNSEAKLCKDITVNGEISFDSGELCAPESACNLEFKVSLNETKVFCEENSCRYPDQVRLDITWQRSSGFILNAVSIIHMISLLVFIV